MFKDAFKAIRAGLQEMAREWKRRRYLRKFNAGQPTPF